MKNILAKTAVILAFSIAPVAVMAQNSGQAGGAQTGATAGGQAGATTGAQTGAQAEGQAGATSGQNSAVSGQAPQPSEDERVKTKAQGAADADADADTQAGAADADADAQAQGTADSNTQPGQAAEDTAQGQADSDAETTAAIPDVDITTEQRTEIRQVIQTADVEPVDDIDFDLSVGIAIPQTIELHPLPPRFVEIVPVYRDYRYFILADGRIVIVEPASFQVVYIIEA